LRKENFSNDPLNKNSTMQSILKSRVIKHTL
jgi:hypothetical protein